MEEEYYEKKLSDRKSIPFTKSDPKITKILRSKTQKGVSEPKGLNKQELQFSADHVMEISNNAPKSDYKLGQK